MDTKFFSTQGSKQAVLLAAQDYQLPLDLDHQASRSNAGPDGLRQEISHAWMDSRMPGKAAELLSSSVPGQKHAETMQHSDQLALNAAFDQLNIRRDV